MNSLLALGAKAATMVISLICGVLTTRLLLGEAGIEYYALFSMLAALPSMLAFTDLGSGAVVVNSIATSDDPRNDTTVRAQVTAVGRILLGFSGVAMILNTVMLASGGWVALFGEAGTLPGAASAAFLCLTIFCLGVPVGIWVRIMLGLRRNHIIILLQGLISPLSLLGVWLLLQLDDVAAFAYLATASYLASFIVSVLGLILSARITRPLLPSAASMVLHPRKFPSVQVMDVGWPMLAQLISYPIAVTTQRYVLAQWGTQAEVAEYGVAGQVFFALNGLVLAAGLALWPLFAHRRHKGDLQRGPFAIAAAFAGSVAIATVAIWALGPWIFEFITNGELVVQGTTILAFGIMITFIAGVYPLGMFIMDKPGIQFQVIPTLAMAFSSLILAIVLTPMIGVAGPPLGNAIAVFFCQIVPFTIYIILNKERLLSAKAGTSKQPAVDGVVSE